MDSPQVKNPLLDRIPSRALTKAEYDRWVENTGRPFTDPWMSLHRMSRPKGNKEYSARNMKEARAK